MRWVENAQVNEMPKPTLAEVLDRIGRRAGGRLPTSTARELLREARAAWAGRAL